MEKVRAIFEKLFLVVLFIAAIALVIALLGGAFPISISSMEQKVKFDLAHIGWQPINPKNGTMEIDNKDKAVGWASLKYSYSKPRRGKPGFYCDNVVMESMATVKFYMKAKKPTAYAMQIKRKSNGKILYKTFRVGKKWKAYTISFDDIRHYMKVKNKIPPNDIKRWVAFVDLTPKKNNTIWFDHFHIVRW